MDTIDRALSVDTPPSLIGGDRAIWITLNLEFPYPRDDISIRRDFGLRNELKCVVLHNLGQLLVRGWSPHWFCLPQVQIPCFGDVTRSALSEGRIHTRINPHGVFRASVGRNLLVEPFTPPGVEEQTTVCSITFTTTGVKAPFDASRT